jgi:hypothetical protein
MTEPKEDDFLIENQDLIGAINSSLARGETLKEAMIALYNAGYDKSKIEEAAKSYIELSRNPDTIKSSKLTISSASIKEVGQKDKLKKGNILDQALATKAVQPAVNTGAVITPNSQHVSKYELKEKPKDKVHHTSNLVTFLLIFILVFLLIILGAVFLFKEELVDFFNRLFA